VDALTQFLAEQGPWGLAVLALGLATKTLHAEKNALLESHSTTLATVRKEHAEELKKERGQFLETLEEKEGALLEEREKRVEEQKSATRAVADSNVALKETLDKLLAMKRSKSDPPNSGRG